MNTVISCKKIDTKANESIENISDIKVRFFNTSKTQDEEIKKLANDIKKQERLLNYLPEFIKKNGMPVWDKVLYKTTNKNTGNASFNSLQSTTQNSINTNSSQGLFFIPLQLTNSSTIQSYITAYKHNDSLYTYKLYNKDSLNNIHPISNAEKFKLLNTQAILGVFEKNINNKDTINIVSPTNGTIKNANVNFISNSGNIVSNTTNSTSSCQMEITISVTYEWRDYVYCYGGSCGSWVAVSVSLTINISCGGSGSSGTGSSGKGSSGTGSSGTGSSGTGNNNYWWNYGTGWPYYNNGGYTGSGGPSASGDPNWDWWWTGGGTSTTIPDYSDYAAPPFTWSFNGDDGTSFTDPDPMREPDFQFDPADNYETTYSRFTNMVKNLKSFVKSNPKVLSALQRYSGFSKQQILNDLTFGQGPTIKIEEMNGRFGFYDKNNGVKTLHIRASYVRGLEQAFLQSTQEGTAFLLAVTILHEYVHFGTNLNNISEGVYDFGLGFERDAFNVIVDDNNAGTVVIKFSKYF